MVDAEVQFVWKDSLTIGAVLGLVSCPVAAETGQTEAVSARYGGRVGEDVPTQRAQEVLLIQQAYCSGHTWKQNILLHFLTFFFVILFWN